MGVLRCQITCSDLVGIVNWGGALFHDLASIGSTNLNYENNNIQGKCVENTVQVSQLNKYCASM